MTVGSGRRAENARGRGPHRLPKSWGGYRESLPHGTQIALVTAGFVTPPKVTSASGQPVRLPQVRAPDEPTPIEAEEGPGGSIDNAPSLMNPATTGPGSLSCCVRETSMTRLGLRRCVGMEWDDLHRVIAREAQHEFENSLYRICRVADPEFLGQRIASEVCRSLARHGETVVIGPDEGCSQ